MLLWIKECTLASIVAFGMRSEGNAPWNGEPTVGFPFMTMLQHRGQFCQGFLSKEQCESTGTSPWLAPANCYLFFRLQSALKGRRFCDAIGIINNATEELKRVSQNCFQECFQHLYSRWQKCTRGLFWMKCNLNEGAALYFSEIK
jgi:hypothetical protein